MTAHHPRSSQRLSAKASGTQRFAKTAAAAVVLLIAWTAAGQPADVSKTDAESCARKVAQLESYTPGKSAKQTTRFSEAEINSYLALDLSKHYHPSLRSLVMKFEQDRLQGVATIDFDQLALHSKKGLTRLLAGLLSGVHTLEMRGKLVATGGKGHFELEEARFDGTSLPNLLVEEIISAVGRKQKPPFDPLQPSELPYNIQSVDVKAGHILVHQ
jgi:hypothetical protein